METKLHVFVFIMRIGRVSALLVVTRSFNELQHFIQLSQRQRRLTLNFPIVVYCNNYFKLQPNLIRHFLSGSNLPSTCLCLAQNSLAKKAKFRI